MCLVKMKLERDESLPPSRRVVVRPVSGQPVTVIRAPSRHSRSSFIVPAPSATAAAYKPAPRPVQYISASATNAGTSTSTTAVNRVSIPRIVHAPTPPPRSSDRFDVIRVHEGGSPRGSHSSLNSRSSRHSHGPVYVSRSRERLSVGAGDRISRTFLTPSGREEEVVDSFGYIEPGQQTLLLEGRRKGTSVTSGPRTSRERVVVWENGRRRESYRIP